MRQDQRVERVVGCQSGIGRRQSASVRPGLVKQLSRTSVIAWLRAQSALLVALPGHEQASRLARAHEPRAQSRAVARRGDRGERGR